MIDLQKDEGNWPKKRPACSLSGELGSLADQNHRCVLCIEQDRRAASGSLQRSFSEATIEKPRAQFERMAKSVRVDLQSAPRNISTPTYNFV